MTTGRDIDSLRSEFFGSCTRFGFLEVAGVGGTAVVFKAWDRELDEVVAVKVLASSSGMPAEELLARFKREVTLNRRLRHPNIARVVDHGMAGSLTRGIISQAMRIGVRDVLHELLYPATLSERVWRVLAQEGFTPTS